MTIALRPLRCRNCHMYLGMHTIVDRHPRVFESPFCAHLMPASDTPRRDDIIRHLVRAHGWKHQAAGDKFGISKQAVWQVLQRG